MQTLTPPLPFLRRGVALAALFAACFLPVSPASAADRYQHPDPELDLTAVYESFVSDRGFDRRRIENRFTETVAGFGAVRILVVPSWLSDTARAAARTGLFDFLGDQIEALRDAGITVEIAATDSEGAVADNAPIILQQIERSPEPICLITHSKGGLDALDALLRAAPQVVEKVRCWIALQSPFAGSPTADLAAGSWLGREAADHLLPALGGSAQSLTDLTVAERRRYLADNAGRIEQVLTRIRVLCFAGQIDDLSVETFPSGIGAKILSWAADRDTPNDGLVPVKSAILPGTHHIIARGVDHAITVSSQNPFAEIDRVLLIKLLLNLVVGLPENPALKT